MACKVAVQSAGCNLSLPLWPVVTSVCWCLYICWSKPQRQTRKHRCGDNCKVAAGFRIPDSAVLRITCHWLSLTTCFDVIGRGGLDTQWCGRLDCERLYLYTHTPI